MIDYKEMENVIQGLNSYVDKLHKVSKTQAIFEDTLNQMKELNGGIVSAESKIEAYSNTIKDLESQHDIIRSQFDTVLQDYKKLHSAFELLDIELKKANFMHEGFQTSLTEICELSCKIKDEVAKLNLAEEKILSNQQSNFAKMDSLINESKDSIVTFQQECLDKIVLVIEKVNKDTNELLKVTENISKAQEENLLKITADIKDLKKESTRHYKEIIEVINNQSRKNKIWFSVLTGLVSSVLVFAIVGLFI